MKVRVRVGRLAKHIGREGTNREVELSGCMRWLATY